MDAPSKQVASLQAEADAAQRQPRRAGAARQAVKSSVARWAAEAEAESARAAFSCQLYAEMKQAPIQLQPTKQQPVPKDGQRQARQQQSSALEDYMLSAGSARIYPSLQHAHRHISSTAGLQWAHLPTVHELAVRNASTEIYIVFKLWLAPPINPWDGPHIRRLIITHVAVPLAFRRRGILSRTMMSSLSSPADEIEIDQPYRTKCATMLSLDTLSGNEAVGARSVTDAETTS